MPTCILGSCATHSMHSSRLTWVVGTGCDGFGWLAPLVHRTEQCEMLSHTGRTFSNITCESVKSFSMASTSASLGVLVRKRPVILCMRCILRCDGSYRVRRRPEVRRTE